MPTGSQTGRLKFVAPSHWWARPATPLAVKVTGPPLLALFTISGAGVDAKPSWWSRALWR